MTEGAGAGDLPGARWGETVLTPCPSHSLPSYVQCTPHGLLALQAPCPIHMASLSAPCSRQWVCRHMMPCRCGRKRLEAVPIPRASSWAGTEENTENRPTVLHSRHTTRYRNSFVLVSPWHPEVVVTVTKPPGPGSAQGLCEVTKG